jgi:hypothetical protein
MDADFRDRRETKPPRKSERKLEELRRPRRPFWKITIGEARRAMPRDGTLTLSDIRGTTLTIVCEPCGRRGQYNVERLMAEHGDAKLAVAATIAWVDSEASRGAGLRLLGTVRARLIPARKP